MYCAGHTDLDLTKKFTGAGEGDKTGVVSTAGLKKKENGAQRKSCTKD